MTREGLEEMRKIHEKSAEEGKQVRARILNIKEDLTDLDVTSTRLAGVSTVIRIYHTAEELLRTNNAILAELRYMNDKGDEVNNG